MLDSYWIFTFKVLQNLNLPERLNYRIWFQTSFQIYSLLKILNCLFQAHSDVGGGGNNLYLLYM